MEKKVVICIGTDEAKYVRARLSLLLVENGKVGFRHYHSLAIEPGADLAALRAGADAVISDPINGIPFAPWPSIPDDEWEKVEKCCTVIHTPEVLIKATKEAKAELAKVQAARSALAEESEMLAQELAAVAAQRGTQVVDA